MEFFGLVGEKLSHSLSPEIHEEIFKGLNVNCAYKLFEIKKSNINDLSDALRTLSIRGVNVTIPYKEVVMESLDEISDEAKKIGAVNTIFNKDGKLIGYNTDYYGFKYMLLDKNINIKDKRVVILGTGGASKAVLACILDMDASEVLLVSRNIRDNDFNDERVKYITYDELKNIDGEVVINATPVGMYPKVTKSPVGKNIIKNYNSVVDLIYNPMDTEFLKYGKELNKNTCGGLMMLVVQAICSEEIWQGRSIDKKVIIDIYNNLSKKF
ncbi:MAG: shikimate dehydrogenase [Clostridium sp.]|uniref:shikimate dehydrogenase n=1 Tax=Clostridium sp. TaxID=1506 RepID=UPI003F34E786